MAPDARTKSATEREEARLQAGSGTSTPDGQPRPQPRSQPRSAGALLIAGPVIFLLAELITAAAWTAPPYSYTYHFISDLGVLKPSTLLGQYINSPLAEVMNAGFSLFGITIAAGTALLRGLPGTRRWLALVPATLLAAGGVLLALFPGSSEALGETTGALHGIGAFMCFVGANTLAIALGTMRRRMGLSAWTGRGLIAAGTIGLVSMACYLAAIFTAGETVIGTVGLIERGIVYPFFVALICAGVSLWRGAQVSMEEPQAELPAAPA